MWLEWIVVSGRGRTQGASLPAVNILTTPGEWDSCQVPCRKLHIGIPSPGWSVKLDMFIGRAGESVLGWGGGRGRVSSCLLLPGFWKLWEGEKFEIFAIKGYWRPGIIAAVLTGFIHLTQYLFFKTKSNNIFVCPFWTRYFAILM